ncbi:hypothetical protein ZIOFF_039522 [Zingiber officinale]|uniref:Uncharacterized protein n=1 Tax=Zingiber officinale TaxID=94328 RepID=A0A8J5G4P0_ZINOF|nr:hypothetical protein ZIOFF_039522 [Zingiber officinale]
MAQCLVDSCGFDQEKVTEASKLLKGIQSRQQPDSVLDFLKSYGFDDASRKSVLLLFPKCLLLDVEKTLAPKLRAFEDLGLSPSDIVHLVRSKDALVKLFRRNLGILAYSVEKIQPNLKLYLGVSHRGCSIALYKMQRELFWSFGWPEDDFVVAFQKCPTFPQKSLMTLQRKMDVLDKCGWIWFFLHHCTSNTIGNELGEKVDSETSDLSDLEV